MNKTEIQSFISKLKRNTDSNKYDYGHVLVIAGSKNMPGAGILCCNSAMRSGAGLVTYAVRENFLSSACAMSKPETMFFVYKTAADILKFIKNRKVSSLVIGPGLVVDSKLKYFIMKIISSVSIPVVLDASGLSAFNNDCCALKKAKAKLVLTPHSGEFSRLINKSVHNKETDIKRFAKDNTVIIVLKGHNTLVSNGAETYKNDTGTPAMATAGSGDVLSGTIAAFAGIDSYLFEAVKFAVLVHGLSGEISEKDKGTIGVTASDISENMCYAVKQLIGGRRQK